ncbi:MAG: Dihydropteroate synthase [Candidatus Marinimicrobia bacterium]|nr:Dihydropteroate synthase [Candidatus Neomarinimicrobiota bacterium]
MQENPSYGDVIEDILQYFKDQIDYARSQGIADEQILIDPGIGFGKTVEHNYRIIKDLRQFTLLGFPVVVGASRKSFIGKTLDLPVGERLEGSLAVAALSIWNGAAVLRVHDVKETKEAISMVDAIRNAGMTG